MDDSNHEAFLYWIGYYVAIENFSRKLPGTWAPWEYDVWLPAPDRIEESDQYARGARDWAEEQIRNLGVSDAVSERCRQDAARYGYEDAKRILMEAEDKVDSP